MDEWKLPDVDQDYMMKNFQLEPLVEEGGFYKRTFTSPHKIIVDGKERAAMSSIYYMLSADSALGYLHKNSSDIMRYYQTGLPILYLVLYPDGHLDQAIVGHDLLSEHQPYLLTPAGTWVCSTLVAGAPGENFGLVHEVVVPAFEPADRVFATMADIPEEHMRKLKYFIKPDETESEPEKAEQEKTND